MTVRAVRWAAGCLVGGAIVASVAFTQQTPPPETAAGKFEGTWYRVDPDNKQAVQLRRSADGKSWDLRFYWRTVDDFEIDTKWASHYTYTYKGFPGVIDMVVDPKLSTDRRLTVHYRRDQDGANKTHLSEEGDLVLYRFGDGRTLVWLVDPLKINVAVPEPIAPYEEDGAKRVEQRLWRFSHVTRRLIQWDEIPW